MGNISSIEWTDATWNPVAGCSVVSPGCHNCYARNIAARFSAPGLPYHGLAVMTEHGPQWTGEMRMVTKHLADPLRWRAPRRVFVNSTSDLFHEGLSNKEIAAVFGVMAACPQHTFQVLTKRAKRAREWYEWADEEGGRVSRQNSATDRALPWWRAMACASAAQRAGVDLVDRPLHGATWPLPNVWLGVSVEDQKRADERIPELIKVPAAVRFVSYEPALEHVDLFSLVKPDNPYGIHWVIVGGESGPGARPFDIGWARSMIAQCRREGTACFVKQLGAVPHDSMRSLIGGWSPGDPEPDTRLRLVSRKGGDMSEWPEDLRVREWPRAA